MVKNLEVATNAVKSRFFECCKIWRWAELNPRPKTRLQELLPSQPVIRDSPRRAQTGTRTGQVASWVLFTLQSLGAKVPHLSMPDSAAVSDRGLTAALIKPQMLKYCCRFFLRFGLFNEVATSDGYPCFQNLRRNHCTPIVLASFPRAYAYYTRKRAAAQVPSC